MEQFGENSVEILESGWEVLVKSGNKRQVTDDSTKHEKHGNAERQIFSMSVTLCRRSSAQGFLCHADIWGVIGMG